MKPSTTHATSKADSRPRHERTPPPTREELAFVEQTGILFEEMGVPRMAGRIVGRLLIAEPPIQSSAQLMRYLRASKGSISTMTRLLIQLGLLERVGVPGERIDHFQLRPDGWERLTLERVRRTTDIRGLMERGLELRVASKPEVHRRMLEVRDFFGFVERELRVLLEQYGRHGNQASGRR
jgi:DNA-binding transcriptional regulator GbsR (MarR family)